MSPSSPESRERPSCLRRSGVLPGFTLLEVLVTLGVIGVILAIAIPSFRAVRESSRATKCSVQLREAATETERQANLDSGLFPFWVANLPGSPPIGRQVMVEVYGVEFCGTGVFACPSDRDAVDSDPLSYTSYRYYAGEEMNKIATGGGESARREITRKFRDEYHSVSILFDRGNWHGGKQARNAVFLPDLHVARIQ